VLNQLFPRLQYLIQQIFGIHRQASSIVGDLESRFRTDESDAFILNVQRPQREV
jgi:hypothetical protein